MKKLLSIFTGKHQPDRDALSAYLDGELSTARASTLQTHLAGCVTCANTLEEMRDVHEMLRALPAADVPRSFRLTAADAAAPRRAVPPPPAPLMRLMPALSAAAVIVFAVTVALDVGGTETSSDESAAGRAALSQDSSTDTYATDDTPPAPAFAADRDTGAAESAPNATADAPAPSGASAPDQGAAGDGQPAGGDAADAGTKTSPSPETVELSQEPAAETNDGGGNNLALRIVEVASAAVAIGAAGWALRTWRRRGEASV